MQTPEDIQKLFVMFLFHLFLQSSREWDTIIFLLVLLHLLINTCLLLRTFSLFILIITFLLLINLLHWSFRLLYSWLIILRSASQSNRVCLFSQILLCV